MTTLIRNEQFEKRLEMQILNLRSNFPNLINRSLTYWKKVIEREDNSRDVV
jgi:hypothetical protein